MRKCLGPVRRNGVDHDYGKVLGDGRIQVGHGQLRPVSKRNIGGRMHAGIGGAKAGEPAIERLHRTSKNF